MAKRGNREGSIYKRSDGRWSAALSLPGGKRRYLYGKTRQDAASRLAAAIRDRDRGTTVAPERQTVGQFLTHWLEMAQPTVRESTFVRYCEYVRLHAIPSIGHVRLARLTAQHLQELYSKKLSEGLSPTTVNHLHAVLHRALRQAVRWELVGRNVTESVDPPRNARSEPQALTPEYSRRFLDAAKSDSFEALYVLAIMTGMRQGELLGLHWRDVYLDQETLQIRSQLQRGRTLGEPKTAKSRRQISLPNLAVEALRRHYGRQLKERVEAGPEWVESDLVFCNAKGNPMNPSNLRSRSFIPLLKNADLPVIRFHDLRHTSATLLLGLGTNPKVVQEILGHSQISVTMDVYSHVLPTMQRDAMTDLNNLLIA